LVAAIQVATLGQQSLSIAAAGNASGGQFSLGGNLTQSIASLVIPQNVQLLHDFANLPNLTFTGNVTNGGSFIGYSTSSQINTATINASNFMNGNGALLTTMLSALPSSITNATSGLNLVLNTIQNVMNAGIISSAGNLSINAGGSIINSLPAGVTGVSPVMSAVNNLNLFSGAGQIINSGTMAAMAGNVNLNTLATNNLIMNNLAGLVTAQAGTINFRDSLLTNKVDLSVSGGNWIARELNLFSGHGAINANFGDVKGIVNTQAGEIHVLSQSDNLVLGHILATGDPTYYNIGNIQLTSDVSVGQFLGILATGHITSTSGLQNITARDGSGQGYEINLVAGVALTPTPCGPCSSNATAGTEANVAVTADGASTTGGNIDFSQSANLTISSASTSGNLNGGKVTLAAYASGVNNGKVLLAPTSQITTTGSGSGTSGDVSIIAGAVSKTGITVGGINTNNGSSNTGQILIQNAQPKSSDNLPIVFNTLGQITSSNYFEGSATNTSAQTQIRGDLNAGSSIGIHSGNVLIQDSTVSSGPSSDIQINSSVALIKKIEIRNSIVTASNNLSLEAGDISIEDSALSGGTGVSIENNGPFDNLDVNILNSNISTPTNADINIFNSQNGRLTLNAAGSHIDAGQDLFITNNGSSMVINNVSSGPLQTGSMTAVELLQINGNGDLHVTNLGSQISSKDNDLCICNFNGDTFLYNNSDGYGNQASFVVQTTGFLTIGVNQDLIITGNGVFGTNDPAGEVQLDAGNVIVLGQGQVKTGAGLSVNVDPGTGMYYMYSQDGTILNPSVGSGPSLQSFVDNDGVTVYYGTFGQSFVSSNNDILVMADAFSDTPFVNPNGILIPNTIGNTVIALRNAPGIAGLSAISADNLFIENTGMGGLTLVNDVDTTGYTYLHSPTSISTRGIQAGRTVTFATSGNSGSSILNGDIYTPLSLNFLSANVVVGTSSTNGDTAVNLVGSGGLNLSVTTGSIRSDFGPLSMFNGGGSLSIYNLSRAFNYDSGEIYSETGMKITNAGGDLNIMNIDSGITPNNGNLDLTVSGGSIYILNTSNEDGIWPAVMGPQTSGNLNLATNRSIYVTGLGRFGAHSGGVYLTGNNIVVSQQLIDAPFLLSVDFKENLLMYQLSGGPLAITSASGQTVSSFVDPALTPVYYSSPHAQVVDTNGAIILSTASFTPATISSGVLTGLNFTGNSVISVRNKPTITSIGDVSSTGKDIYLDIMNTSFSFLTGSISTTTGSPAHPGSLLVYALGFINTSSNSIDTSTASSGNRGGDVRLFAPGQGFGGQILAGNINTSATGANGTGNDAGSVTLFAGSGINTFDIFANSNVIDGQGNGGNVLGLAYQGGAGYGSVSTSTQRPLGDAGFIHLQSTFGMSMFGLQASATGSTSGHGGAITLIEANDFNFTNGIAVFGDIDNHVDFNGNAGFVLDPLTGLTGVKVNSIGDFSVGSIVSTAAGIGVGSGAGGNISVTSESAIFISGNLDTSSYAATGTEANGGSITLNAAQNVEGNSVFARGSLGGADKGNGGNIIINSASGEILLSSFALINTQSTALLSGNAGFVHMTAAEGITAFDIAAYTQNGSSGSVTLATTSLGAGIQVGNIDNSSISGTAGGTVDTVFGVNGVAVVSSGSATIQSINSSGTTGGQVTLAAQDDITLGIDLNGFSIRSQGADGGDLSVATRDGAINVQGAISTGVFNGSGDPGSIFMSAPRSISVGSVSATANLFGNSSNGGFVKFVFTDSASEGALTAGGLIAAEGGLTLSAAGSMRVMNGTGVQRLVLLSGNNISVTSGDTATFQSRTTGQGQDIFLVAGADIAVDSANQTALVFGPSSVGGNINLQGASALTLDTKSVSADCTNCDAGSTTFASFGAGPNTGQVNLPSQTILDQSGSGGGVAGSTTLIAGSSDAIAMKIGGISGSSGAAAGSLSINNAQPISNDGANIDFNFQSGEIVSRNSLVADPAQATIGEDLVTGNINIAQDITFNSSNVLIRAVNVSAGGNITVTRPAETPDIRLNLAVVNSSFIGGNFSITNNSGGNTSVTVAGSTFLSFNDITISSVGGSLGLSNLGGTVEALSGAILIANSPGLHAGPGIAISNSGSVDGFITVGVIRAGTTLTVQNNGGGVAIANTAGLITSSQSMNITSTGGGVSILNGADCAGNPGTIQVTGTGNLTINASETVQVLGDGIMAAPTNLVLTSTNGSIIFAQQQVTTGGGVRVNYTANGNALLYTNTGDLAPLVDSGPALSVLTDNTLIKLYYFGQHTSLFGDDVLILSTGTFTDNAGAGGTLTVGSVTGDMIVSNRNDPNLTAISALSTNGNDIYVESTGANGINFTGALNTQTSAASGSGGSATLYSKGAGTTLQNVNTSGKTNGDGGGLTVISSGGNLLVNGAIDTFGSGTGNGGGVFLTTSPGSGDLTLNGNINAVGGNDNTFGGGGVTIVSCGACIATNRSITTSAINVGSALRDAGSIQITAAGNVTVGQLTAIGNSAFNGHAIRIYSGGAVTVAGAVDSSAFNTLSFDSDAGIIYIGAANGINVTSGNILAGALGPSNGNGAAITLYTASGDIQTLAISNSVTFNGVAGAIFDSLSGNVGIGVHAGNDLSVNGEISSTAALSGGRGSGGDISLYANGTIETVNPASQGVDASSYGDSGFNNNAGNISVEAGGTITLHHLLATGATPGTNGSGGDISVQSHSGTFVYSGAVDSSSYGAYGGSNNAGAISISTAQNLTIDFIRAIGGFNGGSGNGGDIEIESTNGSVTLTSTTDFPNSSSYSTVFADNNAGAIQINALTDILGTDLIADGGESGGNGGSISATADSGSAEFTGNTGFQSNGNGYIGSGGSLSASGNSGVTVKRFNSNGGLLFAGGGDITVDSADGAINIDTVVDSSAARTNYPGAFGNGGVVSLTAKDDVNLALNFFSSDFCCVRSNGGDAGGNGGNIEITSSEGSLVLGRSMDFDASACLCQAGSTNAGTGGNITVNVHEDVSPSGIQIARYLSYGGNSGGNGGDVSITAGNDIYTADIRTAAARLDNSIKTIGNGGMITVDAGRLVDVNGSLSSLGGFISGDGGNVMVSAVTTAAIHGAIESFTSTRFFFGGGAGTAGSVEVLAGEGINVGAYIGAYGGNSGSGNNVSLTTGHGEISVGSFVGATGGADAGNIIAITGNGPPCPGCTPDSITIGGNVDTSAGSHIAANSGFIHLESVNGITVNGGVFASSNGPQGDSGAITMISTGTGPDDNIFTRNISNGIANFGNAGTVTDTVSGFTGINIQSGGSVEIDDSIPGNTVASINGSSGGNDFSTGGSGSSVNITAGTTIELLNSINTSNFGSSNANAGDIMMLADGLISTGDVIAKAGIDGVGDGGLISLTSSSDAVSVNGVIDNGASNDGSSRGTTIHAATGITVTGNISSTGGINSGLGGEIDILTTSGEAQLAGVDSRSLAGEGSGTITISAPDGIFAAVITAGGGGVESGLSGNGADIELTAADGEVQATSINAGSYVPPDAGPNFNGGMVTITAGDTITIGDSLLENGSISTVGVGDGHGGAVTVTTTGNTGDLIINSASDAGISTWGGIGGGGGGFVDVLVVGNVEIKQIATSAAGIVSGGPSGPLTGNGNGGEVQVIADGSVTISTTINTQGGPDGGDAGHVTVASNNSFIEVGPISASALNGFGYAGAVSVQASDEVTVGAVDTNGGADGGDGGAVELISDNSSILSGFLDSSAPFDGLGGDITLTATNGLIAVNGTNGIGAAINSAGAGVGLFNFSGLVEITFGSAGGDSFLIDKNAVGLTNGAKGAILSTSDTCGCFNSVSINNAQGDLNVALNDKIDTRGSLGSQGVINLNNPGTAVTVNGNANGELLGFLNASGTSVSVTLLKSATTLDVGTIAASSTPPDLGVTLNVNVGASSINLDSLATITSDSGDITITTPTLNTEGEVIADNDSIFITAGNVHNSNLIQAQNGVISIANAGSLLVDMTVGGTPFTTGTLDGGAIDLTSLHGSVTVFQENVFGPITGSAATDFFVDASTSGLAANGPITATSGKLTLSSFSADINVTDEAMLTAGTDIELNAFTTVSIASGTGSDPVSLNAGQDVLLIGGQAVTIGSGSVTDTGVAIEAGRDVAISSFSDTVQISGTSSLNLTTIVAGRDIDVVAHQGITLDNLALALGLQLTANRNVTITSEHDSVLFNDLGATNGIGVSAGVLSLGNNPASLSMTDYNYSAFSSPGNVMVTAGDGDITVNSNVNMLSFGGDIGLAATEDIYVGGVVVGPTLIGSFFAQGGNIWMTAGHEVEIGNASNGTTINSVARFTGAGIITIGPGWGVQSYRGGGLAIYAGVPIADFNQLLSSLQSQRVPPGDHNVVVDPGVDVTGTPLILQTELNPGGNLLNFPYVEFRLTYPNGSSKGVTASISTTNSPTFNIDGGIVSIDPAGPIEIINTAFNVIGPPLIPLDIVHSSPPVPPVITVSEPPPPITITTTGTMPGSEVVPTDITRGRGYNLARAEVADALNTLLAPIFMSQDIQDLQSWLFVSSNCQPYMFDDDDTMIFGRTGTIFAAHKDHRVKLQEGRLVLVTDRRPLTVETDRGEITVPEDSVSIIDESSSGVVRVLSLSGKDTKCSVGTGSQQTLISATSGQEVVVADASIGEEELIAVDGVERQPVGGTITVGKMQVRKQTFDRKRMWEIEPLFSCKMTDQWDPVRRQVTKLRQNMGGQQIGEKTEKTEPSPLSQLNVPALPPGPATADNLADHLQPIAYRTPTNSMPPVSTLRELSSKGAVVKFNSSSQVSMDADDLFTLSKGDLLVTTTKHTVIRCGKYHVAIDPGTIALISMSGNTMKVHDLWESKGSSMHVYAGPKLVSMTVGQELIVSGTESPIAQEMRKDQIGRRRVHMYQLSKAEAAAQAEVSIVSLILCNHLLSEVFHSKQAADHSLSEKLIKMAACLTQATATHGPYSTSSR
jgi:hypothetical protein